MVLEGNTTGVRPRGKAWWGREIEEGWGWRPLPPHAEPQVKQIGEVRREAGACWRQVACKTPLKPLSEGQLSSDAAEDRPESKTSGGLHEPGCDGAASAARVDRKGNARAECQAVVKVMGWGNGEGTTKRSSWEGGREGEAGG